MKQIIFALNTASTAQDLAYLQAHKVKIDTIQILEGTYQGVKETSYLLDVASISSWDKFKQLLKLTDQDCILFIDGDIAYIAEQTSDYKAQESALGKYKKLTAKQAQAEQFASYNTSTGDHFIYA